MDERQTREQLIDKLFNVLMQRAFKGELI